MWLLVTLALGACTSPAAINGGEAVPSPTPMSVASLQETVGPLLLHPDLEPSASYLLAGNPDALLFEGDRAMLSYDLPSGQVLVTQGRSRQDWTSSPLPFGQPTSTQTHAVSGFSLWAYQDSQGGDEVGPPTVLVLDPGWLVQLNPLPDSSEPELQAVKDFAEQLRREG